MTDIRWKQRFENLKKAYSNFNLVLKELKGNKNSIVHKMAIIQTYKMVFELSWKTMKDFLSFRGISVDFPRDVIKEAFAYEIIEDGEVWIKMLDNRNLTAHVYDENKAELVIETIEKFYSPAITQVFNYLKGKI